jgi:hypothetical protein
VHVDDTNRDTLFVQGLSCLDCFPNLQAARNDRCISSFDEGVGPAYLKTKFKVTGWVARFVKWGSLLLALLIMLKGLEILMRFYIGLTLITFVLIMFSKKQRAKMLMLIATYITSPMHGQQRGILLRIHIFV